MTQSLLPTARSIALAFSTFAFVLASSACSTPPVTDGGTDSATSEIAAGDVADAPIGMDTPTDTPVGNDAVDAPPSDGPIICTVDLDCDDHTFCNGAERCMPGAAGANANGCIAASPATPCMAMQTCDEAMDRCQTVCDTNPDADSDGHRAASCGGDDCDDSDANRFPGRTEVCDAMMHDEDCDAVTYGFRDADSDGSPDARCCNVDSGGAMHCGDDCDDMRRTVNPSNSEVCDGFDNNCNGMTDEGVLITYRVDADGDGFADPMGATMMSCSQPPGYAQMATDCNDAVAAIHPGAVEQCDVAMVDEDCDGTSNPSSLCMCTGTESRTCIQPGACASGMQGCVGGSWGACSIMPVTETCNGVDDDCDGTRDEGLTVHCYVDGDNDGYAAMGASASDQCPVAGRDTVGGCPSNLTNRFPSDAANSDCNDAVAAVNPGVSEVCDGARVDEDCDGTPNPVSLCECDGTMTRPCAMPGVCAGGSQLCVSGRYGACTVSPSTETCDGQDNDCDGMTDEMLTVPCFADPDNDGFAAGTAAMSSVCPDVTRTMVGQCPNNYTNRMPGSGTTDCAEGDPTRSPALTEVCDGIDNDCDGMTDEGLRTTYYRDADGDMYGNAAMSMTTCTQPPGYVVDSTDCDDTRVNVHPALREACDGLDNDCNGIIDDGAMPQMFYPDGDGDGYGRVGSTGMLVCAPPAGYAANNTDCDDTNSGVHPNATEACNMRDDDCDGMIDDGATFTYYRDADADGYGDPNMVMNACLTPMGYVNVAGDCDDTRNTVHPMATEHCNRRDDDCSLGAAGMGIDTSEDVDNDGYSPIAATCATGSAGDFPRSDCNDTNASVHPGATEVCDGIDQNCTSTIDDGAACPTYQSCRLGACHQNAAQVSAGASHACAVDARRHLHCWGLNSSGQVGNGTTTNQLTPAAIGSALWDEVAAGGNFTCARLGGTVTCWGSGASGQLGDGATFGSATRRTSPGVAVTGFTNATQIVAGGNHACALRAGAVSCWGSNASGQLGDGTLTSTSTPTTVTGLADAVELAAGQNHTCARRSSGAVVCWGSNSNGQLGNGTMTNSSVFVPVSSITNAVAIGCGYNHSCAVGTTMSCWGDNSSGALGNGTTTSSTTPVTVSSFSGPLEADGGNGFTFATRATGVLLYGWGNNSSGQLATGTMTNLLAPRSSGVDGAVQSFSAGGSFVCDVDGGGGLWCAGSNTSGQLGDGTMTSHSSLTEIGL